MRTINEMKRADSLTNIEIKGKVKFPLYSTFGSFHILKISSFRLLLN